MKVLLDANVLYPVPVRDILLSLADRKLFQAKWSADINNEWVRNLLFKRQDIRAEDLARTVDAMNRAFPDANTDQYQHRIAQLSLPDPNDRHVLAAAIEADAELIITFNLKDFPDDILEKHGIEAVHPDNFIEELIQENTDTAFDAFEQQLARLRNPPLSREYVLEKLSQCGLTNTASSLRLPGSHYSII
ncbi:MAG: PIN domain-containing protein [Bacteroidota bacterium]